MNKLNFALWRSLRIVVCALLIMAGVAGVVQGQNSDSGSQPVYLVDIDGMINPGTSTILEHAIQTAEANRAAALVVRINTPGGLLSSTREMVTAIEQSRVPIIGYVGPSGASATSAGAFILLSTHLAVMSEGTNLGASSPIAGDGADIEGTLGKKIMNDSRAFMRGIAERRYRNADVAERFVSEAESLTASEAQEANVVDLVVPEFSDLISSIDGREINFHGNVQTLNIADSEIRPVEPRLLDRVLELVAHPQIAHMLISLGVLAIYIEILSPGLAFPGIFGVVAVILGLVGAQTLPVNTGFLILLFLGISLMVAEYFVAGFGVLGIGGAIAFTLGSLNLFDAPISADYRNAILSISIAVSAAMLLTTFLVTRSVAAGEKRAKHMVDKSGEAMVSFDREGWVLVNEQRWPAETLDPLHYGDPIVVVEQKGDKLVVRKAHTNT